MPRKKTGKPVDRKATKADAYLDELQKIHDENDGVLRPTDVVEFARNPNTALHRRFQWDDGKAAELYRLSQARGLIRISLRVLGAEQQSPVRAFVSLTTDRKAGGYRAIGDVMTDAERRAQLLADSLIELQRFRQKYNEITELAEVFEAIERIIGQRAA